MLRYKEAIIYSVFIIVVFVIVVAKLQPEVAKIIDIENNIKTQTGQEADLERKLETLKKSEIEKQEISAQSKKIYKPDIAGLDEDASFAVLLDDVIDMAKYNSIKIYSIKYTYNPKEDDFVKGAADKYIVCQLEMQVISDYADLESFLRELYKYPYLINIDKIELSPYTKNKRIIITNLQIKLYTSK